MVLNPRQFAEHLRKTALATYERPANSFLNFMDRQGADIQSHTAAQLDTLERLGR